MLNKIKILIIILLSNSNLFSQRVIEGLSPVKYVFISQSTVNQTINEPCEGERLDILIDAFTDTTKLKTISLSGKVFGAKKSIIAISINDKIICENSELFKSDIQIQTGTNKLKIKAISSCGNSTEKNITITGISDRKDYAIFIVADEPGGNFLKIQNALSDAENLMNILMYSFGFECEIIKNPGQAELNNLILKYKNKQYNSNDQLFVYLIGHGSKNDVFNTYNFELKNYQIEQETFKKALDGIPANHILFVANTCFSGSEITLSGFRPFVSSNLTVDEKINKLLEKKKARKIIAAGKDLVPAGFDSSPLVKKITDYLISHNDDLIIFDDMAKEVTSFKYSNGSTPVYGYFGTNSDYSTFVFVPINLK